MKEFKNYLEGAFAYKKQAEDDQYYSSWEQDLTRYREESWKHLEVWKLRRQKISFIDIGIKMKITEDTAKKSFYRACELTQGKAYDLQALRREVWLAHMEGLQKSCATCPDYGPCDTLCPEMLQLVTQDEVYLQEKLLKEDSDSIKDYLFHKNLP